jgi:hypothetical protein
LIAVSSPQLQGEGPSLALRKCLQKAVLLQPKVPQLPQAIQVRKTSGAGQGLAALVLNHVSDCQLCWRQCCSTWDIATNSKTNAMLKNAVEGW